MEQKLGKLESACSLVNLTLLQVAPREPGFLMPLRDGSLPDAIHSFLTPPNLLQMELQSCVATAVQAGPMEIANVFLRSS